MYPRFTFTNTHSTPQITRATRVLMQIVDIARGLVSDLIVLSINFNGDANSFVLQCVDLLVRAQITIADITATNGIRINAVGRHDNSYGIDCDLTFLAQS